ncbi:MAG: twin-arginine translocase TatA/TatE family subunit [Cytophagaceae bacterium]|jgi:sec-independent protein translocase protein TatA|nr:twin-arginine translocase TatA/TatE family subunit [Cytophagaceae bacterium]
MTYLFIFLGAIGPLQIALIVIAVLLLFGGRKIPELMKGLGEGMREFKKARNTITDETKEEDSNKEALKN